MIQYPVSLKLTAMGLGDEV